MPDADVQYVTIKVRFVRRAVISENSANVCTEPKAVNWQNSILSKNRL